MAFVLNSLLLTQNEITKKDENENKILALVRNIFEQYDKRNDFTVYS